MERPKGLPNIKMKTLGGKQFWTDVLHFHSWRIQVNSLTKHYRLLDRDNNRHASGNYAHCHRELDGIKRELELPAMHGKAVVLLHGLGNARSKMEPLAKLLRENGYQVFNVTYASTRSRLEQHASALRHLLENLNGIEEINFVCFSLGNVVVRHYLHDITDSRTGQLLDRRMQRMVMLGPPNNGAQLANRFSGNDLFELVYGASASQLGSDWEEAQKRLATPSFEFGIIAGCGNGVIPQNPLIQGVDDFVVGVEETRLAGAADFLVVETSHTTMVNNQLVQQATLSFLKNGHFTSVDRRQPISDAAR